MLKSLGDGKTSKVYKVAMKDGTDKTYAVKLLKDDFLRKSEANVKAVEQEITIMGTLNHEKIVKLVEFGSNGQIKKKSGRELKDLIYIMMEHVRGPLLFDLCENFGALGEDAGRFFCE